MSFKTFTEEQTKEAQTFIETYKAQMYRMFEYIIEDLYDYDSGDPQAFTSRYTAEQVEEVIWEEAEQFTQEYYIPETVADYLAHTNFGLCGETPFDWLVEAVLDSEDEDELNDAVARCILWGHMAIWVVDDFFANVAKTIYDTDGIAGLEYAEDWGVSVRLFA